MDIVKPVKEFLHDSVVGMLYRHKVGNRNHNVLTNFFFAPGEADP